MFLHSQRVSQSTWIFRSMYIHFMAIHGMRRGGFANFYKFLHSNQFHRSYVPCSGSIEMSWSSSLELSGSKDGMDFYERAGFETD
jgi:hypothetical protein